MLKLFIKRRRTPIQSALVVFSILQLTGCGSTEDRAKDYYTHGLKLLSEHESAKAALEFRNAVRLKSDLLEAWKALAEIDQSGRNWQALVADLRSIVALAPNDGAARSELGKLLLRAGSTDEALRLVNAGLEIDNRNADFHALKAAIALRLNDHTNATSEARAALELDSGNADALMVLAVDQLARGDAKQALQLLQTPPVAQAEKLEDNLSLQLLKIRLLRQTGDLSGTEAALKKVIERNPSEVGYRKLLINLYVEQNRTDDAEKELRSLVAANPSDPESVLDLVRFLYTTKKAQASAREVLDAHIGAGGDIFRYQIASAEMDIAEGKLTDGERSLEKLIRASNSPENVRTAKIALAQIYLSKRNFDSVERLATDILSDDPHNVAALRLRGTVRLEKAQPDLAIADLLDALNYQPRSADLMSLLATAYERSGLMELADKQFADAVRLSDFATKVSLEYAAFLQRRGSIAHAEDILIGLNKRRPDDIGALLALGRVRLARQNWSGAEAAAKSIQQMGDHGGGADEILGAALIGSKKYDEAIAVFQSAYSAAPTAAQPMASLVEALLQANKKDQAIAFLRSILAKNPEDGNARVLLGSIQATSGTTDQALNNYLAAVRDRPNETVGYQALAGFYVNQRNYDAAILLVRSGIQRQPDAIALHMILANAYERKGDYEAANSEYEYILGMEPGNLIAANNLASLLLDHKDDKASLKRAQALVAMLRKSQVPQFKDTLGWASYRQGDYRTAVSLSESAVAALPDQATVHYHLGMCYIAIGELVKASEQLKRALELLPENQLADTIRAELKKTSS